jgi:hypothetical protein
VPNETPTTFSQARRRRLDSLKRRAQVRPLDHGTTELVRVIQFLWTDGRGIQPVLMVERELLN